MRTLTAMLASALALAGPAAADGVDMSVEDQLKALRADVAALKAGERSDTADRKSAGLELYVQMTGFYNQSVAAGDDGAGVPKNRANASAEVDLGMAGKPSETLQASAVLRLNSKGVPEAFDIWAEQALPAGLSLRGGFLDLTGIFDASAIANDEKTQFVRSEFVDNPAFGQGSNAVGLRLHWQAGDAFYVQAAVQDKAATATDPFDGAFAIAEAGLKHGSFGGGELKVWARESGRGRAGEVPAYGVVLDQGLGHGLAAFARWGQEFKATGLGGAALNGGGASSAAPFVTANVGMEWTGPLAARPQDRLGAAWGSVRACDTSDRDYAEAYYSVTLSENALLSLHYQADFSRLLDPVTHDWDGDGNVDTTTYAAKADEHKLVARVNLAY